MECKRLGVDDVLFDCARVGQPHADLRVFELRPQDARRVQKQQPLVDRDPLLAARDAGAVFRLGALAPGDLVDERRFPHVRDADDHELEGPSDLSLFRVARQLFRQQLPHSRHEAGNALLRLAVGLQDAVTFRAEMLRPALCHRGIGHIDAVEDDHPGFRAADGVDVRVAAGKRDARIQDLAHGVDKLHVRLDHPARLGHVARIPLDIHR